MLDEDDVLCLNCGYHRKLKRKISGETGSIAFSANPYEAPQIGSLPFSDGETLDWFFSIEGRVSRLPWCAVQLAYYIQLFILFLLHRWQVIPEWLALAVFFLLAWVSIVIQVKRWHDLDKSGFWCFIHLMPFFGTLFAWIDLGLERGTIGFNQYGADPTSYSTDLQN